MKEIQEYRFFQTSKGYAYQTKEVYDEETSINCNKVNKILSKQEVEIVQKMEWGKCREYIENIINTK